jgi:cell volume regulation protein A
LVSLLLQGWTVKPLARRLGLIIPPRMGAVDKVEVDLPGAVNHELLSYRVVRDSPVLRGERIPRWATPSLIIRDGKSMRYQYAGRLKENDLVYLFITPTYSRLLDRLFASRAAVDPEDAEFFGAFSLSPTRPAADLDAAYGPGLLAEHEKGLTIAELIKQRLGGKADYADRVRLGSIILIVRDLDENDHISAVGMSLEAVEPATNFPIFINLRDMIDRCHGLFRRHRRHGNDTSASVAAAPMVHEEEARENGR